MHAFCLTIALLFAAVGGSGSEKEGLQKAQHPGKRIVCAYDNDCFQSFCSKAGYDRIGSMVRRNSAGTKLYLCCLKGEELIVLAVDSAGAVKEIARREEAFTYLVLNAEEKPIAVYNSALETLTTEDGSLLLSDVVAFQYDCEGKYFAYVSGNEPKSIRIASFNAPQNVLAHTERLGSPHIFSNDKYVFLATTEGFGKALHLFCYRIDAGSLTLTEKRPIRHPRSKGLVNPGLYPKDMDVDAQVLLCTLSYDTPLSGLDRMYLFDLSSGEFTLCDKKPQSCAFLLQQCIPLDKTMNSN